MIGVGDVCFGVEEGEAFEVRTCDKKESVMAKCEKCFGKRNREIMRDGFS